jgi:RES domain-containing protein
MRAFRIADRRFPNFDGTGARLLGGRWNSPGRPVIYASETFAGAVLEILVHANLGRVPSRHGVIEIEIPDELRREVALESEVPGWDKPDFRAARRFGDKWLKEGRTAVLSVPSAVTQGRERNLLLNPEHPDFRHIHASAAQPVRWDDRLFREL